MGQGATSYRGTPIFTNLPVTMLIGQRVGPTVSLTAMALIITLSFAIPLGVIALKVGSWIDRLVMVVAVLGFSVPSFVLAYTAILCFSVWLDWLPVQGYASLSEGFAPFIEHLILPSIVLGLIYGALIARITRAAMPPQNGRLRLQLPRPVFRHEITMGRSAGREFFRPGIRFLHKGAAHGANGDAPGIALP